MFDLEFYPTPLETIERMLNGYDIQGKIILEPSAGAGHIVSYLKEYGVKTVIAAEKNADLRKILLTKCKVIAEDFLTVTSDMISHIDMIVMNPPFSNADEHILHAYNIAPEGCDIIALCNSQTVANTYSNKRKELHTIISNYGSTEKLGDCFSTAERKTFVDVSLVKIKKAGQNYDSEFDGFFLDEEIEKQENGIMSYNVVRDLVNRYTGSIKIYDEQLAAAVKMNNLTTGFYSCKMGMSITENSAPTSRNEFKKEMQKAGWRFIFAKMNMDKYATKGLKNDINKFVEQQTEIPFTMRNIYRMLDIVIGTTSQRMDKAIIEVFDKLTSHYHDNRYNVEGWKTNSHYLVNRKFIFPYLFSVSFGGYIGIATYGKSNLEILEDLIKALCYISGKNYDGFISLSNFCRYRFKLKDSEGSYIRDRSYSHGVHVTADNIEKITKEQANNYGSIIDDSQVHWGQWNDWGLFRFKAYKKGTGHFEFKDEKLWHQFNQHVARIKGYPLYEGKSKK